MIVDRHGNSGGLLKIISGVILLIFIVAPSRAQSPTLNDGNTLLISCQVSVRHLDGTEPTTAFDSFRDGECLGLISGVNYVSLKVCPSNGVTLGQSVRVVYKYLRDRPERLNERDAKLAEEAFTQAFPCKH